MVDAAGGNVATILLWIIHLLVKLQTGLLGSASSFADRDATGNGAGSSHQQNYGRHRTDAGENNNNQGSPPPTGDKDDNIRREKAYKLFELDRKNIKNITTEQVKKKYKRLSLIHHPDRNANSPESNQKMQDINLAMELIEEDLQVQQDASKFEVGEKDEYASEAEWKAQRNRVKKELRKERKRQRRQEEERRKREAEMEKELREEIKKQQQQWKRKQRDAKQDANKKARQKNLYTDWGQDEAYEDWCEQMAAVKAAQRAGNEDQTEQPTTANQANETGTNMEAIDDDDHGNNEDEDKTETTDPSPTSTKRPVNAMMEHYSDVQIILALRDKELHNVALGILQHDLESSINHAVATGKVPFYVQGSFLLPDLSNYDPYTPFFLKPYDPDGNTILHYAVYFEATDVIQYVAHAALNIGSQDSPSATKNGNLFCKLFLNNINQRYDSPDDFIIPGITSPEVIQTWQTFVDMAKQQIEDAKVENRLKRAWANLCNITFRKIRVAQLLSLTCMVLIGRNMFGCHWITSSLIVSFLLYETNPNPIPNPNQYYLSELSEDEDLATHLASYFTTWRIFCFASIEIWQALSWWMILIEYIVISTLIAMVTQDWPWGILWPLQIFGFVIRWTTSFWTYLWKLFVIPITSSQLRSSSSSVTMAGWSRLYILAELAILASVLQWVCFVMPFLDSKS